MSDKYFGNDTAGTKTIWILQFRDEPTIPSGDGPSQARRKAHFYIPYPENSPERKSGQWLDTTELQKAKDLHEDNIRKMDAFCKSLEEKCKSAQQTNSEAQKSMKENIDNLGKVVKRFNELLRRFKDDLPSEEDS
ncbi:MAG: hypothetical protein H7A37_01880 [Chlamydiales bacterium]|nr:hypothetical protein [Chlamydiia bacterium]MCP5507039.1 hypothetical protein [Chlamydiales bacterium]